MRESTLLVSWPQGGGIRGRRDSQAAGEAQPLQLRGAQGGPPPQAWTAPPGHLAHFAGSWFQAGLSGAAGEPGSLSGQRPIGGGGGCQSAWTVSRASASAPNGCPHPHRQRACLQSRVPHTCLPRGGRGDLSGRQSAQPALPLGSRARARSRCPAAGRFCPAPRVSVRGVTTPVQRPGLCVSASPVCAAL